MRSSKRGPRRLPRVRPQDRQHRWLERDASGLENAVLEGRHPSLLLARVAQDPRPGQALERAVRRGLPTGLGSVSRSRSPEFRATAAVAPTVGDWTPHGGRPGECPGPVRQARPLVDCVPPPRRPPHQQHAGPPDARDEPLLRPGPTPARFAGGLPVALSCVGVVVELHALASGDGAGKPRLAVPRRTPQPAPLSRLLAAKSIDLRIAWWIPMSTPPKSVTVRRIRNGVEMDGGESERPIVSLKRGNRAEGPRGEARSEANPEPSVIYRS